MADNLTTTTTVSSVASGTVIETRDQGSAVERQVVSATTVVNPSSNFTRPANTTAYAVGQLIGNSTTAASVVAMTFICGNSSAVTVAKATFSIRRVKVKKVSTTTALSVFRFHLFATDPAASTGIVGGDGTAFNVKDATYLGSMDITSMFALNDCAIGHGVPNVGADINVTLASGQTVYGLLEARAAYVPTSAEVFTVVVEALQW